MKKEIEEKLKITLTKKECKSIIGDIKKSDILNSKLDSNTKYLLYYIYDFSKK